MNVHASKLPAALVFSIPVNVTSERAFGAAL